MKNDFLDEKVRENVDKLSEGSKLALVLCAQAFRFGANWGFLHADDPELKVKLNSISPERKNVALSLVSNGAIIRCNEQFLVKSIVTLVPEAKNYNFVTGKQARLQEEKERFSRFLARVAEGKESHMVRKAGMSELVIGIFSTNDVNMIRLNGIDYPAYKLALMEALTAIQQTPSLNGRVLVKAVLPDGKVVFDDLLNVASNSKGVAAIYKGLELSDTNTGVFLTIRVK